MFKTLNYRITILENLPNMLNIHTEEKSSNSKDNSNSEDMVTIENPVEIGCIKYALYKKRGTTLKEYCSTHKPDSSYIISNYKTSRRSRKRRVNKQKNVQLAVIKIKDENKSGEVISSEVINNEIMGGDTEIEDNDEIEGQSIVKYLYFFVILVY